MTRTKPTGEIQTKPRRLVASIAEGSNQSGRGWSSGKAAGLSGRPREMAILEIGGCEKMVDFSQMMVWETLAAGIPQLAPF